MITTFNKTSKRILLTSLENYYQLLIKDYRFYHEHSSHRNKQTLHESVDRKFRIRIKAVEVILHNLGSKLFDNVEKPSFRQSKNLTHVSMPSENKDGLPRYRGIRPNYYKGKI